MARAFTARENAPAAPPLKARTRRDGARAGWPRLEPPVIGTGPRELAGHGPLGDVDHVRLVILYNLMGEGLGSHAQGGFIFYARRPPFGAAGTRARLSDVKEAR